MPAFSQGALDRISVLSDEAAADLQRDALTAYGCVVPFHAAGLYSIFAVHHAADTLGVGLDGLDEPVFAALMERMNGGWTRLNEGGWLETDMSRRGVALSRCRETPASAEVVAIARIAAAPDRRMDAMTTALEAWGCRFGDEDEPEFVEFAMPLVAGDLGIGLGGPDESVWQALYISLDRTIEEMRDFGMLSRDGAGGTVLNGCNS